MATALPHTDARVTENQGAPTPSDDELVPPDTDNESVLDGLLSRLPEALGDDVVFIRSDANYVHVSTTKGKTMLLYSISRAAIELGERGLLVHRSYWVAREHVEAVRKQGNQTVFEMSDGTVVPVSRRRQKDVVDFFGRNFRRVTDASNT